MCPPNLCTSSSQFICHAVQLKVSEPNSTQCLLSVNRLFHFTEYCKCGFVCFQDQTNFKLISYITSSFISLDTLTCFSLVEDQNLVFIYLPLFIYSRAFVFLVDLYRRTFVV